MNKHSKCKDCYKTHLPEMCGVEVKPHSIIPSDLPNANMDFTVTNYRDEDSNNFIQVTVTCNCGRGGFVRIPTIAQAVNSKDYRFTEQRMVLGLALNRLERINHLCAQCPGRQFK